MTEIHDCRCIEPGCRCEGRDSNPYPWCDECGEGIHDIPINRNDGVMDMTYAELEREPLFDDEFLGYEY